MLVLNMAFQTVLRPVIIPAILIRPVETPTYKNEKKIVNKMITALRAPANYVQVIAKSFFDLDKSQ